MPEEQPIICLLEVDHVPLVLPDAGHLPVGTVPLQKSFYPPSHVVEENHFKEWEADPHENQLVTLKVIPIVNLGIKFFAVGPMMIQEKTKLPTFGPRRKSAPDTKSDGDTTFIYDICQFCFTDKMFGLIFATHKKSLQNKI